MKEIEQALNEEIDARDAYIQAPVDTHEDAYRMLLRNKQSHEVRKRSPKNSYPEEEIPEDSSESTDYGDSSLIESFHTQLAFQNDEEKAINHEDLDREQQKPRLEKRTQGDDSCNCTPAKAVY